VNFNGEVQRQSLVQLNSAVGGILKNYRASLGMEFRVQVPVVNVPFRLIFAYNPNARVFDPNHPDPTILFLEKKFAFRFSIGRTF
jgi:outer membrane protein insertion porin family